MSDSRFILAGVMGWPVAHSRSPAIHNHWIAQYGLRGTYVTLPVQPERLPDAVRGLRALGFAGCNVTVPHKVAAMALMDDLHPVARAAARARCWPPTSSWSVRAQSSTPLAAARAASASGVKVPSETTEWQCRSALRKGTWRF